MALTREDIQILSDLIDEKLNTVLDEKLNTVLDEKLNTVLDEKLNTVLDEKLKPINDRLEILEIKSDMTHKRLDNLVLDMKVSERAIRKDIRLLQDAQETLVTVLEGQHILPAMK